MVEHYSPPEAAEESRVRVKALTSRLVGVSRGARVLEIGVGAGVATRALAGLFDSVTVVDPEPATLRDLPGNVVGICSRVEVVALAGEEYDHIVMLNLLEHVDDPVFALRRCLEWLAPEGVVHVVVNLRTSLHRRVGLGMGLIGELGELTEKDRGLGHRRVYGRDELVRQVWKAGLRVKYKRSFYLKPLPTGMMGGFPPALHDALDRMGEEYPTLAGYFYLEACRHSN